MSEIIVKDLECKNVSGMDLFNDSESFMVEIYDENKQILGGDRFVDNNNCFPTTVIVNGCINTINPNITNPNTNNPNCFPTTNLVR